MQRLLIPAAAIADRLRAQGETIAIAESSTGGLISAALLAMPGASTYFLGGAVVYTRTARGALLGITDLAMEGMRASTEPYAKLLADRARENFSATWALAETGAAGPTGNRYGDAAGHVCIAISGPRACELTLETALADRLENMFVFAEFALRTLLEKILA